MPVTRMICSARLIAVARVVLMALVLCVGESAFGQVTVRVEPQAITVAVGEPFDVQIIADITQPVVGWGIDFTISDPAILSFVGAPVIGPSWTPVYARDFDNLAGAAFPGSVSGNGILLATITVTARNRGESDLQLGITVSDLTEGLPLESGGFDGVVLQSCLVVVAPSLPPSCSIDADCDDGLFCNGAEVCPSSRCQFGTPPCHDSIDCTDDSCDDLSDSCSYTANDANCDDGLFCNGVETCDAVGGCQAGTSPCGVGLCNEGTDACVECLVDYECWDGIDCSIDQCVAGICSNTPDDSLCDDGDPCTIDSCDLMAGCVSTACCGNGVVETGEECDPPDGETCDANCQDIPPPPCPGEGDCFVDNGTIGCDCAACCELVCDGNPLCCSSGWNQSCVDDANTLCPSLYCSDPTQAIMYVDGSKPLGGDGLGWTSAFKHLQDALDRATCCGSLVEQIWVAQGTYFPDRSDQEPMGSGLREATFQLASGVKVYGGFPTGGSPFENRDVALYVTTLSGDLLEDDLPGFVQNDENSYHVVSAVGTDPTTLLEGFTITAGNGDSTANFPGQWLGGGLYLSMADLSLVDCTVFANTVKREGGGVYTEGGDPQITDCIFTGNRATGAGTPRSTGGAFFNEDGDPIFAGCSFVGNSADDAGGALGNDRGNVVLSGCTFDGNWIDFPSPGEGGGALFTTGNNSSLAASDCVFQQNVAGLVSGSGRGGGAIYSNSDLSLTDCTFSTNFTVNFGGAIDSKKSVILERCTFTSNSAGTSTLNGAGGALYHIGEQATLKDCQFVDNFADAEGGGAVIGGDTTLYMVGCDFIDNLSNASGGGMMRSGSGDTVISNCVFCNNVSQYSGGGLNINLQSSGDITVTNSLFVSNEAGCIPPAACSGPLDNSNGGALSLHRFEFSLGVTRITNSTFAFNIVNTNSSNRGGGIRFRRGEDITVENCILWGNTLGQLGAVDTNPVVRYSNIQDGVPTELGFVDGVGNIDADPLFADADGPDGDPDTCDNNLRLLLGSPCIDAADDTVVPADFFDLDDNGDSAERTPLDLMDKPRFRDDPNTIDTGVPDPPAYFEVVDMGAYEFQPEDCNGNGLPDSDDIANGTSQDCTGNGIPDECEPDCNNNGQADSCDIADGTSEDCNENLIPDECDIASGTSQDENVNAIPDECECTCMDVVFVLDATSSMSGAIANVKSGISDVITVARQRAGTDLRMGLITFVNDVFVHHSLTTDLVAVQNSIEAIVLEGSIHPPEASDEALREMITMDSDCVVSPNEFDVPFRSECLKLAALVTDALPAGCDGIYTEGVDDVSAQQRALDAAAAGIRIFAIYVEPPSGGMDLDVAVIMHDYAFQTDGLLAVLGNGGEGMTTALLGMLNQCLDCNYNSVPDYLDISEGTSQDENGNDIPDECECTVDADCDDGVYCNGSEPCEQSLCAQGTDPCPGQICDEDSDSCSDVMLVAIDATTSTAMNYAAGPLSVCNVYVRFGDSDDELSSILNSNITTDDPAGFFQHPLGDLGDTAPAAAACGTDPEVCLDSFVTIGVSVNDNTDSTQTDGTWNTSAFNNDGYTEGGWLNSNPANQQGVPDGSSLVLIAQLTVNDGFAVSGDLEVLLEGSGIPITESFVCFCPFLVPEDCPADLDDDNLVGPIDLAILLGAWGLCPGGCPQDLSGDCKVGPIDLAILLGSWGLCPQSAQGGGDFLREGGEHRSVFGGGGGCLTLEEAVQMLGYENIGDFIEWILSSIPAQAVHHVAQFLLWLLNNWPC